MATMTTTERRAGVLRRPTATTGLWSWFTTIDHKKIGILYGATAFLFFVVGGIEALLIRSQLAGPDGTLVNAAQYNQIFTMHGITMIFLFVMPMSAAFFNYLIPLMIGARDVAFPRLNAYSYWVFLLGGLFLYSSFFLGGAPNGGWFGYAPNSSTDPSIGMTFYALGLIITGIASTAGAVNLAVTVINLRAPGMSFFRTPVFVWMGLVVQLLLAFSLPIITVALFELLFDRRFGTHFFDPTAGGDPLLWQHLFWLFGHPEVYVLILPAFGIFSEILPVFSRKPLFGYQFVVFSGIAIGFIGFGVWAHHMFAAGLGPVANTAFGVSTAIIAIPTGVKIFNWLGTMFRGDIRFTAAMLFTVGGVAMFVIGGLSGVTHAIVPSDYQQTDTYYIVAHFHYVIFGGGVFAFFSALFYWWPKVFGRQLSEPLGKIEFWLMLIGFNLTFGPMHILGLQGMIRRTYTYPESLGLTFWNQVATVGAFLIALSVLLFIVNAVLTRLRARPLDVSDPWDGRTLEWMTTSPPPVHNFDVVPTVHALDDYWHRKYVEDERSGRLVPAQAGGAIAHEDAPAVVHGHAIHLPSPSYWPLVASLGMPLLGYGVLYSWWLVGLGAVVTLVGLFGWAMEPSVAPERGED
jgi:cytochrome c oxidase subunit 1